MQRVFTTGQVAKIFSVNINTVIKWFDEGKLEGFRLPRSNERRIYRESVVEFMRKHDIATELLDEFVAQLKKNQKRPRKDQPSANALSAEARREERRVLPRVSVDLEGEIRSSTNGDGVSARVQVRNLSMSGAYVIGYSSSKNLIPAEFHLNVAANDRGPALDGVCQVIHARRGEDQTYAIGVRFTRINPNSIQRYVMPGS